MTLESLNVSEALRYMGYRDKKPDDKIMNIVRECEQELLKVIVPRYIYRVFDIVSSDNGIEVLNTSLVLTGKDISVHLQGCTKCALSVATVSDGADMLIRKYEATDMTRAVITDCLASAAVEQVCNECDGDIFAHSGGLNQTWRFSAGYGDLPIEIQKDFVSVLNAQKRIGVNVTDSFLLTPRKSVTAIVGLSEGKVSEGRRGCSCCNMKDKCQFRKRGEHCEF